jgi:hypothetical protein
MGEDGRNGRGAVTSYPMTSPPANAGFGRGVGAALVAAFIGAVAWAVITDVTNYRIGFVAVGIGFLVGLATERYGGGDPRLPVPAAVIALLGCLLGDLFATAFIISSDLHDSIGTVLQGPHLIWRVYTDAFRPFDFVFYAIAAYEGFRFAQRGVLRARAARAVATAQAGAPTGPPLPPPPPPPPPTEVP